MVRFISSLMPQVDCHDAFGILYSLIGVEHGSSDRSDPGTSGGVSRVEDRFVLPESIETTDDTWITRVSAYTKVSSCDEDSMALQG